MATPPCELEGASIVLVGSFNPAIFQPAWFAAHDLIGRQEADAAIAPSVELGIVTNEVTSFRAGWLTLQVTRNRFFVTTAEPPNFAALRDLVDGTFTILEHTPIARLGMNREIHFRMPDEEAWHKLGHHLAPKAAWNSVLDTPGLRSMLMQGKGKVEGSAVFVRVEPSVRVSPGIFMEFNDDRPVARLSDLSQHLKEWDEVVGSAKKKAEQLVTSVP